MPHILTRGYHMSDSMNVKQVMNSLRVRVMLSAMLLTLVLLPMIGVTLNNAFEQQVRTNVSEQLNAYFYSILAVTEFENGQLLMPQVLLDNQFNLINSGHYALISSESIETGASPRNDRNYSANNIVWFSNSFLGSDIAQPLPLPDVGRDSFGEITLNNQSHFIYSYTVRFDVSSSNDVGNDTLPSITLHIIKDVLSIDQQLDGFSRQLWSGFLVIIAVFVMIQLFWLAWTLKPLARFTDELKSVETGKSDTLSLQYPNELQAVAKQLNKLLINEKKQRMRYRNALSDLAHSLKTPLAVMQSDQELSNLSIEQIRKIDKTIEHQLKRAQSAGSQAWHKGMPLEPVGNQLVRTLQKLYPTIHIDYRVHEACIFNGDESDITEMLGNLLDNACKAAKHHILLNIYMHHDNLFIDVEDDGNGLTDEQTSIVLERGSRLDTYEKGHGIGLAIVQDLVLSYEGKLTITQSDTLGGAKFSMSFSMN